MSFTNSLFPAAIHPLITGGNFTVNNTHIQNVAKGGYELLVEAVAPNALHNSGHVFDPPRCHPGTRVAVIQAIIDWIAESEEETRDKDITWLTGAAGAGKSAIGRSVCERCMQEGLLLASFFFGSNDPTRNHSRSLVATIVYQICCMNPSMRQAVSTAVENDPLIFARSLRDQFSTLLINPLSSIFSNEPRSAPQLIVIDGLDECENYDSRLDILHTLVHISTVSKVRLRFLVCSRPENQIVNFFSSTKVQDTLFEIFLGYDYRSTEEIMLYLSDKFKAIKEGHIFKSLIPDPWPDEGQINAIAIKAYGQYIYAATVVHYVESSRHRPHQRLDSVLGLRPPLKDLPFSQLDALYTHILSMAEDPGLIISILAFPALYDFLNTHMIERILELEPGDVRILLSDFGSIVRVTSNGHIDLLHKTFADYIWDRSRSKVFFISRFQTIASHVQHVLQIFSEEHTNCRFMCREENPVHLLTWFQISCNDWDNVIYAQALEAVIRFPVRSFCKLLFSHDTACQEYMFPYYFFNLIFTFKEHPSLKTVYHAHLTSFCECIVEEIRIRYCDDLGLHYKLASKYIQKPYRANIAQNDSSLISTLHHLEFDRDILPPIDSLFRHLTKKKNKQLILSRASAFCLEILCGRDISKIHNATRLLGIGKGYRHIRRPHPLKWRRKSWSLSHLDQPVLMRGSNNQYTLSTLRKLENPNNRTPSNIESIGLMLYIKNKSIKFWGLFPFNYLGALKYFVKILPRAGRYPPLIHLCKTKSFSAMSMAFPHLSRRARRAIERYLERMESEGNVG